MLDLLRMARRRFWDAYPRAEELEGRLLGPIARLHRRRLRGTTFVAVTGSAGKTTTKELLAAVLAKRGAVVMSEGTRNSRGATRRALFRTRRRHQFCVQEIGIGSPGSIDLAIWQLAPDIGVVTNVGWDHRSAFRSQEAIAAEKQKVVASIPSRGLAILNADDPRVRAMADGLRCRVLWYGRSDAADLRAEDIEACFPEPLSFTAVFEGRRYPARTQLHGEHWTTAVLAALAGGVALGVPLEDAVAAVAGVAPTLHRLSVWRPRHGPTFLLDDFKGAEWTFSASLNVLGSAATSRRVAVIGQISDSRRGSRRTYRNMARLARESADLVVVVGRWAHYSLLARTGPEDRSIQAFETPAAAAEFLKGELGSEDLVLIKSSSKLHLARLALQFQVPVQCWVPSCEKRIACADCEELTSVESPEGLPKPRVPAVERDGETRPAWPGQEQNRVGQKGGNP